MQLFAFIVLIPLFTSAVAVPMTVNARALLDSQNPTLSARQWAAALRAGGRKAGKEIGKEPGSRSQAEGTVKTMAANFEKMGRPQNMKCLEGMVDHMMQFGGANMVWPCDKKDPKQEEKDRRLMEAKQKAFGGKK